MLFVPTNDRFCTFFSDNILIFTDSIPTIHRQYEACLKTAVFWETLRDIERVSLKTLRVSNAENSFFSNALYLSYRLYRLFSFSCQTIFQICYKYNSPSVYYSIYPLINYLLIQYSKHTLRFDTLTIH